MMVNMLHGDITDVIIKAFYKVYNIMGYGFLEKVYENAIRFELNVMKINVDQPKHIPVYYRDEHVGDYFADLLVEELVIVELKAAESLCEEHEAQLLNYLKATNIEVGLLLNFGKEPQFKRKIYTNDNKKIHPLKSV